MADEPDDVEEIAWFVQDIVTVTLLAIPVTGSLLFSLNGLGTMFYALGGVAGLVSLAYKGGILGGGDE